MDHLGNNSEYILFVVELKKFQNININNKSNEYLYLFVFVSHELLQQLPNLLTVVFRLAKSILIFLIFEPFTYLLLKIKYLNCLGLGSQLSCLEFDTVTSLSSTVCRR